MITPGLSETIRFLLIALAAYDFTDIVYSANVLRKLRGNK
ncbi:putative membrane protein [Pediococcus claussenii ATCC BAA-344]|uniref:Membrane protein n=1 Tax=Pediococcus claussenii (strain ATCC BAA-344 / DSM 14800 / JCM 18046 / KCTC 3811 / LMG 21948 / P06) TaxID=701521 RepID=G8PCR8_PEDCP|nr:putative membrane protein [Pediococcus claussenii ATCC BAA-344]